MTQIELSQEELDLIQAKREEAAAREKEIQERVAGNIEKGQAAIVKRLDEYKKQNAAAETFLKELGEGWTSHIEPRKGEEKVYWDGEVVWSQPYTYNEVSLKYGGYTVSVHMHTVYSGTWGRGNNKGYKMFLSGPDIEYGYSQKALSKAATVNKKVQERIQIIKDKEEFKKRKMDAVETAVSDLKTKFPDAEVTASKDWTTRGYGRNNYREYDKLVVKLKNGIELQYEVYSDGSLKRLNVLFGCKDDIALIGALGAIELPSTTK